MALGKMAYKCNDNSNCARFRVLPFKKNPAEKRDFQRIAYGLLK